MPFTNEVVWCARCSSDDDEEEEVCCICLNALEDADLFDQLGEPLETGAFP